jgi:hypothetical protein
MDVSNNASFYIKEKIKNKGSHKKIRKKQHSKQQQKMRFLKISVQLLQSIILL